MRQSDNPMKKKTYPAHLFIISAPSGAGKSSLIKAYLAANKTAPAKVAISHTTREPRPGEHDGEHYFFVSSAQFESMIQHGDFVEHAPVFHHYYGTSKKEIEGCLEQGMDVFLDIDWQGARQVRQAIPEAKSIFILPPSLTELEKRLVNRGQDTEYTIQKRMQEAQSEMSHYKEYDYVIINDQFTSSIARLSSIIQSQKLTVASQRFLHRDLLVSLGLESR